MSETAADLTLQILENESILSLGHERLDMRARVPLECLGIETVNRCADADFYASPLLYSLSTPLECQSSPCGSCECTGSAYGNAGNGHWSSGEPWTLGSPTLSLGGMKVSYCVEGDTLWAGGGKIGGEAKVAYKFERRSCVGTPLACSERATGQCGSSGDCLPGRCRGSSPSCAELYEEASCSDQSGCQWDPEGCWGTASESCELTNCGATPGCSWGPPKARCGGEPRRCHTYDVSDCSKPGCSVRFCAASDEPQIDPPLPCAQLTANACSKSPGCTLSGNVCTGTTSCDKQTDREVCTLLACTAYDTEYCGGVPQASCSTRSVEDCRAEPGCRIEW